MMNYSFRDATPADMPMLRAWLETPEVRRWWGNPDEQEALLREDLEGSAMTMLIVALDGTPFAYVQHCDVGAWPQDCYADQPQGTRAIDTLIGLPAMIGQGHAAGYLRQLATDLRARGAPRVMTDPAPDNHRARRAYAKAGFAGDRVVETADGPAVLMIFAD